MNRIDAAINPLLKGLLIFFLIYLIVRLMGKKQVVRMNSLELMIGIFVGQIIFNTLASNSREVTEYLLLAVVVVGTNYIFSHFIVKIPLLEKIIEGQPEVIILNGQMFKKVMRSKRISETELLEALREHEVMNPEEVKCAILEKDGNISVIKYGH